VRICFTACVLVAWFAFASAPRTGGTAQAPPAKQPETLVLSEKAVLGKVTFSHLNHTTKNYNVEGTKPVTCVECHHVEQPAADAKKFPPHETAYPPDRTTTLTAELLTKSPETKVTACRNCHARKDEKPAVWPELPKIKSESSTAIITLTNQQAFHRACAGCHDQVVKTRPDAKAPTTAKCVACHKKV
jgi:cytochrome c553